MVGVRELTLTLRLKWTSINQLLFNVMWSVIPQGVDKACLRVLMGPMVPYWYDIFYDTQYVEILKGL
jgi:hypothetical protein